jgi:SAM-dependent methyltransferase
MSFRNLLKAAERRIGTRRAAGLYYGLVFRVASRLGVGSFNYGYAETGETRPPEQIGTEPFQLELYRQTALAAGPERLAGGCILEISCGLGGGLAHVAATFAPRLAVGVDLIPAAVANARRRFGLIAVQADATDLRLPTDAFDVVLSVEASHVYFGDAFLAEVAQVLRRGGRFVLTDNRRMTPEAARSWLEEAMRPHGLQLIDLRDITANVVRSCELDTPRREGLLARLPRPVRPPLREMIGGVGTAAFANMRDRRTCYFIATAEKA